MDVVLLVYPDMGDLLSRLLRLLHVKKSSSLLSITRVGRERTNAWTRFLKNHNCANTYYYANEMAAYLPNVQVTAPAVLLLQQDKAGGYTTLYQGAELAAIHTQEELQQMVSAKLQAAKS